jgi:hypothetical protein
MAAPNERGSGPSRHCRSPVLHGRDRPVGLGHTGAERKHGPAGFSSSMRQGVRSRACVVTVRGCPRPCQAAVSGPSPTSLGASYYQYAASVPFRVSDLGCEAAGPAWPRHRRRERHARWRPDGACAEPGFTELSNRACVSASARRTSSERALRRRDCQCQPVRA